MSIFKELRALALLRRIARAQERIADAAEEQLAMSRARYERKFPTKFKPRPAEFGVATVDALNAAYRRDHPRYDGDLPPAEEWEA